MEAQQDLDMQRGRREEAGEGRGGSIKKERKREQRRLQGLKSCYSEGRNRNRCICSKCYLDFFRFSSGEL